MIRGLMTMKGTVSDFALGNVGWIDPSETVPFDDPGLREDNIHAKHSAFISLHWLIAVVSHGRVPRATDVERHRG